MGFDKAMNWWILSSRVPFPTGMFYLHFLLSEEYWKYWKLDITLNLK